MIQCVTTWALTGEKVPIARNKAASAQQAALKNPTRKDAPAAART